MSVACAKAVAPIEAACRLAPTPQHRCVQWQGQSLSNSRRSVRVSATAESATGSLRSTLCKHIISLAGKLPKRWVGQRERIVYSSEVPTGSHIRDLAEIWAREFGRPELVLDSTRDDGMPNSSSGLAQVQKALKHSFRVTAAYAEIIELQDGELVCTSKKLIGLSRCVSDGYFAAEVVDCCVDPEYQRRGIGTKLIRTLCKETIESGAQSIAVFSVPDSRLFFWKAGFRMDFRYKIMVYDTLKPAPIGSDSAARNSDVSVEELSEIFGARR